MRILRNENGGVDGVLAFLACILVIAIHLTVTTAYNNRDDLSYGIGSDIEVAVEQICKNAILTPYIDDTLRSKLNKHFAPADYQLSYLYSEIGDEDLNEIDINTTKLHIGDTIYIQFNLNIPKTGATAEQLALQPSYTKLMNQLNLDKNTTQIDRMPIVRPGVVENNAK